MPEITSMRRKATESLTSITQAIASVGDSPQLDIELGFLIHDVSRMRAAAFDRYIKPLNVSRSKWYILAHLSAAGPLSQAELAERLKVGRSSVGSVIPMLYHDGLVRRQPSSTDLRSDRISLTSRGRRLVDQIMEIETAFNDRILAALSVDQRELMASHLSVIKQAAASVVANGEGIGSLRWV